MTASERGAFLLLLALVAHPAMAHAADPTPEARETARARMAVGRSLRKEGNDLGALAAFRQAYDLVPVPTTALELARTLDALGRLVEARAVLAAIRHMPTSASDPAPFAEARSAAAELDRAIEPRIGTLRVDVSGSLVGYHATLDDNEIPMSALVTGVRVDPRDHRIVLSNGDRRIERVETVAPGATSTLILDLEPAPTTPAQRNTGASAHTGAAPTPRAGSSHTLTIAGFALGGVGLTVGLGAGAVALGTKPSCVDNRCPPPLHDDIDRAKSWANVATGGFIVAGVGVGILVATWLFGAN